MTDGLRQGGRPPKRRRLDAIPPTIAVDTGCGVARTSGTGLVAVDGHKVIAAATVRRTDCPDLLASMHAYCRRVLELIDVWAHDLPAPRAWLVAVEFVTDPSGWMAKRRSRATVTHPALAAWLAGAIYSRCEAIAVYADHHGRRAPVGDQASAYYPPVLIGRRPDVWATGSDAGPRVHEQAAYDLAYAAHDADRDRRSVTR